MGFLNLLYSDGGLLLIFTGDTELAKIVTGCVRDDGARFIALLAVGAKVFDDCSIISKGGT